MNRRAGNTGGRQPDDVTGLDTAGCARMKCPTCGEELALLAIEEQEPWYRCTGDPDHEFEVEPGPDRRLIPLPPRGT